MLQIVCQWLVVVFAVVLPVFSLIKDDIEGVPAREPKGFAGVVATLALGSIAAAVFYGAGAFDCILRF